MAGSTTPQFGRYRKPCSRVKNAIFIVSDPEDGTAGSSQTSPYIYEITCHYLPEDSHGHRREMVKSHKNNIYLFVFTHAVLVLRPSRVYEKVGVN
jgi:hypothetical protein